MDASASILRPLSPYGSDERSLPSFPRLSALRCCGSSGEQGNNVPRDRGTGGSAALRDDYGGLRERSGITRAAVLPALSAASWSEGLVQACSQLMRNPTHGGVPLLWWTDKLSTSQKNTAPPCKKPMRTIEVSGGGLSAYIPAAFQSSVSSPHGRSSLRTISARVGTFLLPALSHCAIQTAAGHKRLQVTGVRLLGWTGQPVHFASDTGAYPRTLLGIYNIREKEKTSMCRI